MIPDGFKALGFALGHRSGISEGNGNGSVSHVHEACHTRLADGHSLGLELGMDPRCAIGPMFTRWVREVLNDAELLGMTEPLLQAYEQGFAVLAELDTQLLAVACNDDICRLLMTVPGVSAMTALAFRTGVDIASRFEKSQAAGAVFGLTPRVYASGEVEHIGRITNAVTAWSAGFSMKQPMRC